MKVQVIGGGIAGASVAYHLLQTGFEVIVYDRKDAGQATSVSAGIICPWVSQRRNKAWYQLVRSGAAYYPEFIQQLEQLTNVKTGYQQSGALLLFKDESTQHKAFKRISDKRIEAPEMGTLTLLTGETLKRSMPALTEGYFGHHLSGGGQVNGETLLQALKAGVLRLGGRWSDTSASHLSKDILTVYTAGAWGNELQSQIPISHQKAQLLHFEMDVEGQFPVIMGMKTDYIISFGEGHFAIGTTHEDTTSFNDEPTEEAADQLKKLAQNYFPQQQLRNFRVAVGLRPYTPNHLPVIQQVNDITWVVNGLGSSGLTAAPYIGKELATLLSGKSPQLDLSLFQWKESAE